MKHQKQCLGCGAYLQSDDPHAAGYLPEHLLEQDNDALICQRCYRIKHYGQNVKFAQTVATDQAIVSGLMWAQGIILVVDLMDFEASIPLDFASMTRGKKVIVAVNKTDLLPSRTPVDEAVTWAAKRLRYLKIAADVVGVSGVTGYGVDQLITRLNQVHVQRWLVMGATNVGKSSLINQLLKVHNADVRVMPTVARFPGTTLACTRWQFGDYVLSDSPGFIPEGRLSDFVCEDCVQALIPSHRLQVDLHHLHKNGALVIPGLAAVRPLDLDTEEALLIGFTAAKVSWQRANATKIKDWLKRGCGQCRFTEWNQLIVTVDPNNDLYIYGLGWVSVRKHQVKLELTIPADVHYCTRPNLIGKKSE